VNLTISLHVKAVPLQACSGPEASGKLRFPHFMTTAQAGGKVVSLAHRPPLLPGNAPGTHFSFRCTINNYLYLSKKGQNCKYCLRAGMAFNVASKCMWLVFCTFVKLLFLFFIKAAYR